MEISEMVWMSLPSRRRKVILKLFIKTETSRIILLESQENNRCFFPQGGDFVLEEKNERTTRPQKRGKGKT